MEPLAVVGSNWVPACLALALRSPWEGDGRMHAHVMMRERERECNINLFYDVIVCADLSLTPPLEWLLLSHIVQCCKLPYLYNVASLIMHVNK